MTVLIYWGVEESQILLQMFIVNLINMMMEFTATGCLIVSCLRRSEDTPYTRRVSTTGWIAGYDAVKRIASGFGGPKILPAENLAPPKIIDNELLGRRLENDMGIRRPIPTT